jgi:hypothetical protein
MAGNSMAIRLVDLIQRVPAEVESKVKHARDHARSVLQDALRAECRLVMRTPGEAKDNRTGAQVPVEVAPGHPAFLAEITFSDELELVLLLGRYRSDLRNVGEGASGLLRLRKELKSRSDREQWIRANERELQATADWAGFLLSLLEQHDPLKRLLAIREDFLGIYAHEVNGLVADEYAANRATIAVYWGVVGLVAEWIGCTVEDLTVVVLAHELSHAYTQLGADIDGRRWPAQYFSQAEVGLKEGLAQYYTERVLTRLERRYSGALKVFNTMLSSQSKEYRTHTAWDKEFSPEAVRRAMLEV